MFFISLEKKIIRYKCIGYSITVTQQSACSVVNPVMIENFASVFNCAPVCCASDSVLDVDSVGSLSVIHHRSYSSFDCFLC